MTTVVLTDNDYRTALKLLYDLLRAFSMLRTGQYITPLTSYTTGAMWYDVACYIDELIAFLPDLNEVCTVNNIGIMQLFEARRDLTKSTETYYVTLPS